LLWSQNTRFPLRGLVLARETGTVLAWDVRHGLLRLDRSGALLTQATAPGALAAVACADDGSAGAAGGDKGEVWLLDAELVPRWERSLPQRVTALAVDALGQQVAAADSAGGVHLLDHTGQVLWRVASPRPLPFLAFVPEEPVLVGCADLGLVLRFDARGNVVWRDGLVAHVGSLAVTGDGGLLALACYTEGVVTYAQPRRRQARLPHTAPCRLAALSYAGDFLLTAGMDNRLFLRDRAGLVQGEWAVEGTPVGLALTPLGDTAFVAVAEGKVLALACH
jgi:hypothetical protein